MKTFCKARAHTCVNMPTPAHAQEARLIEGQVFKLASSLGQLKRLVDILGKPADLSLNVHYALLCCIPVRRTYCGVRLEAAELVGRGSVTPPTAHLPFPSHHHPPLATSSLTHRPPHPTVSPSLLSRRHAKRHGGPPAQNLRDQRGNPAAGQGNQGADHGVAWTRGGGRGCGECRAEGQGEEAAAGLCEYFAGGEGGDWERRGAGQQGDGSLSEGE